MRALGEPTEIIVHHSASPLDTTVEDIHSWHVGGRGWSDIGYHYVITMDGVINTGRPLQFQGAHCPPNKGRIGICVVGNNVDSGMEWMPRQEDALLRLVVALNTVFTGIQRVMGHREVAATECPGVDIRWPPR